MKDTLVIYKKYITKISYLEEYTGTDAGTYYYIWTVGIEKPEKISTKDDSKGWNLKNTKIKDDNGKEWSLQSLIS